MTPRSSAHSKRWSARSLNRLRTPAATRFVAKSLLVPAVVLMTILFVACGSGNDAEDAPFFPNGSTGGAVPPSGGERATATPVPEPQVTPATCTVPSIQGIARDKQRSFSAPPAMVIEPSKSYVATMQTTRGTVTIALAKETPITTNN